MSDFLKVEGETDSPIELSRYYEANGFDALAVLTLIAFYSLERVLKMSFMTLWPSA